MRQVFIRCVLVFAIAGITATPSSPAAAATRSRPAIQNPFHPVFLSQSVVQPSAATLRPLCKFGRLSLVAIVLATLSMSLPPAYSDESSRYTINAEDLEKPLSDQGILRSIESLAHLISQYWSARRDLLFASSSYRLNIDDVRELINLATDTSNEELRRSINQFLGIRATVAETMRELHRRGGLTARFFQNQLENAPTFLLEDKDWKAPSLRTPPDLPPRPPKHRRKDSPSVPSGLLQRPA